MNLLNRPPPPQRPMQHGFVSVFVLMILFAAVLFILSQTVTITSTKDLDSQRALDSVAALALADSGRDTAIGSLSTGVSTCSQFNGVTDTTTHSLGRGTYQYVPSSTATTTTICPIRVKGAVNTASQTIESQITFTTINGDANWGSTPTLTMKNPYTTPAVSLFELAWRVNGSVAHGNGSANVSATICTLPSCVSQWNLEPGSGQKAVGAMATTVTAAALSTVSVTQTIGVPTPTAMDYVEVGEMFGGLSVAPTIKGNFTASNPTNSFQNSFTVTNGPTANSSWCDPADTMAFGISQRAGDYTSTITSISFNTTQPIGLTQVAHYPNTDGSTANSWGDVFAEVWYAYNAQLPNSNRLSSVNLVSPSKTINVASTTGYTVGTIVQVFSGIGTLPANTTIASKDAVANTITLTNAPSVALVNATLCGGTCALFTSPSTNGPTTVTMTPSATAGNNWAAGFVCLSGVDPTKIRALTNTTMSVTQWHQVVSGE